MLCMVIFTCLIQTLDVNIPVVFDIREGFSEMMYNILELCSFGAPRLVTKPPSPAMYQSTLLYYSLLSIIMLTARLVGL